MSFIIKQNVFGFEISINNVIIMQKFDSKENLGNIKSRFKFWERAGLFKMLEEFPCYIYKLNYRR